MATKKKTAAKPATKTTRAQLLSAALASFKSANTDWKSMDEGDLYGVESDIDALLHEPKYAHIVPGYGANRTNELALERLTFDAIKLMQRGKRHRCDPYYDEAFGGRDGF